MATKKSAPADKAAAIEQDSSELTPKQQRFADEYLIDLNATAAYKRAGYSADGNSAEAAACRLLSNVKVAEYVQAAMDRRAEKVGVSAEYVLNTIFETVERCKQARPVLDRKGGHVMVVVGSEEDGSPELALAYTFDSSAVLKGAELLGKHLKMFTDKTEHSGPNGGPIEIAKIERVIVDPSK